VNRTFLFDSNNGEIWTRYGIVCHGKDLKDFRVLDPPDRIITLQDEQLLMELFG
jgi:hypothetical protein